MEPINWYGVFCLSKRECYRFLRVYNQSILTPIISGLIFLAVFSMALGADRKQINGIAFMDFIGYGIIIMSIIQNAFANSSSSFTISKMIGYISDILIPPLGSFEILIAFTIGAVIRGLLVGVGLAIALSPFITYTLYHPFMIVFFVVASCSLLGMFGVICGMWAKTFDQSTIVTSYIITPLSFLSGSFYSVSNLPEFFRALNNFNPFFFMIDGFRYCLTNVSDGNIWIEILILLMSNVIMFFVTMRLLDKGCGLKN